jgi:hypothetical protein
MSERFTHQEKPMLNSQQLQVLEKPTRTLFTIASALLVAPLAMFAVLFFLREPPKFTTEFDILNIIGLGFIAMEMVPAIVIPLAGRKAAVTQLGKSTASELDQPGAATKAMAAVQTSKIIQMALFEGALFFNLIAFHTNGSVYSLAAAGFCWCLLIVMAPFPERSVNSVEEMLRSAKDSKVGV